MAKNKIFLVILLGLLQNIGIAQPKKYFLYFKDKANTPYTLAKPQEFLSERAIQRRTKQNINIAEKDFPVNANYIQSLKDAGAKVWYTSRWMNGALIEIEEAQIDGINALPFVKTNTTLVKPQAKLVPNNKKVIANNFSPQILHLKTNQLSSVETIQSPQDYGKSFNQAAMLGADVMHQLGFKGEGLWIAVFDGGFKNANQLPFFQHLYTNNQVLVTYDFVNNDTNVYDDADHGTQVLSAIAGYEKGKLIGTAPNAQYCLFRTEDVNSEYKVEEVNWLIAAEYADSLGVDIINASLGYNQFSDPSMNYTYKDLDGNTAFVTQAADFAAATGILVVNSAGNEGNDAWKHINVPADADSIIAVGAVDANNNYALFSSVGYSFDKRIKPDLAAQGLATTVGNSAGNIIFNNGTSFSSPVLCGMVAGFWQANPTLTNMQVIDYLKLSASQANKPDSLLGYGIPNFTRALDLAKGNKLNENILIYPNPWDNTQILKILWSEKFKNRENSVRVYDLTGKQIFAKIFTSSETGTESILKDFGSLTAGVYVFKIYNTEANISVKVVRF